MNLDWILGQSGPVTALKNALQWNTLTHAYLFHGEGGVGKRTTAQAFAAQLLCDKGTGCGECLSCGRMTRSEHPDLRVWSGTDSIKIDTIRHLKSEISRQADGMRVWIIVDADRMTVQAANSFLKTLEEPPAGSLFILTTDHLHRLLPTVVSRCQMLSFQKLPETVVVDGLYRQWDGSELGQQQAELAARLGRGSLGRAVSLLDSEYMERRRRVLDVMKNLPALEIPEILGYSQQWNESRDEVVQDLELMVQWYRDVLCIQLGQGIRLYNPDYEQDLWRVSEKYSRSAAHEIVDLIYEMIPTLRGNARPRFVLGYLLLRMKKGALI